MERPSTAHRSDSRGLLHLEHEDTAIIGTNDDATRGKRSAVSAGYYQDDFVGAFGGPKPQLWPPLMNRGNYARSMAMQTVVERFLTLDSEDCKKRQIVSLGCGFDTLYFRLAAYRGDLLEKLESFRYFEVDFAQVVSNKRAVLKSDERFAPLVSSGSIYALFDCDLRNTAELTRLLESHGFEHDAPTLFLSECVLIYMSPEEGSAIIEWAAKTVPHSAFCTYEQINPHDAFGKTMIRNLEARNIPLHSLMTYPDLEAQRGRYTQAGYRWSNARNMINLYERYLDQTETKRVNLLEPLDEVEEWRLVLSHYMVVLAGNDESVKNRINF